MPDLNAPHDHIQPTPSGESEKWTRRNFIKVTTSTLLGVLLAKALPRDAEAEHKKERPVEKPALTKEDVEKLVNERIQMRTVAEIEKSGGHCVDGRCQECCVGVAGGEAGLLLPMLAAIEDMTGKKIDEQTLQKIISEYPDQFYMHTSTHALEHILKDPKLNVHTEKEAEQVIQRGIQTTQAETRERLTDVVCNHDEGCGHLNLLKNPKNAEAYKVRTQLVESVLRQIYKQAWKGDEEVRIHPLHGEHEEGAVVIFTIKNAVKDDNSMLPTVRPSTENGPQFFVVHPQYAEYRFKELAPFLQKFFPDVDGAKLEKLTLAKYEAQATETVSRLAKGRPKFTVTFNSEKPTDFTVEASGTVK